MVFLDDLDNPLNEVQGNLNPQPAEQAARPAAARAPRNPAGGGVIFNFLSLCLLGASGLVLFLAYWIYSNPYTPFNPYPPYTPIPTLFIPSATPTATEPVRLPGTWTPTVTATATATVTNTVTNTPEPTVTGTPPPPTPTVPNTYYNYLLRGSPAYLAGGVMHPDDSCKLWVAGQALDMKGSPVIGITVELGGTLDRKNIYLLSLTGTALQYGPGGYEFVLSETALASNETVWVQLLNQEMVPISERVYFNTYANCEQNLALVNFKQVK